MPDHKTFIILDGNSLLHRAWHAIPPLTTKDGLVVNAAYGFTNVVEKMLSVYKPDYMAVAWDLPGKTFRHEDYAEYKATREKKPDELFAQIPIIQKILKAYGIPSLSAPGFEADDILGTIAKLNSQEKNLETLIVTGDLDSLQLVDDITKVVFFVKGLSEVRLYDPDAVKERYGLEPKQLIDLKTLLGDASDNLPGVPGIGAKTAAELLQSYGSIDEILKALKAGDLPEKFAKKLEGQNKTIQQMKKLVTIVTNVPLKDFDLEQTVTSHPDVDNLIEQFQALEFKTLLKKYHKFTGETQPAIQKSHKQRMADLKTVSKVDDLTGEQVVLVVETKATDLFGGGIARVIVGDGQSVFEQHDPDAKALKSVIDYLASQKKLIGHDIKATMHALSDGGEVDCLKAFSKLELIDSMLSAYLLSSSDRDVSLAEVVENILGYKLSAAPSASELVTTLTKLDEALVNRLRRDRLLDLYTQIEAPLICVLYKMERNGILVDKNKLAKLSDQFAKELEALTKKIYKIAGQEFNINSPSQLAEILFERLKLPTKGIKKTKTGLSTAAPELEKLAEASPIIPLIEDYREIAKLKSTYADALPTAVAKDGRIHTTFNQTIAATGRLSSINPNLQNIPIRSDLGLEIRKAFVAETGKVLLSADYSQIELRLAAHLAKDQAFIQAFKDGADIHSRTAAEIWDVAEGKVTRDQRAAAKAINFSILYGVGARSLARATKMSFNDAKHFIERYFETHPAIREFMDAMRLKVRQNGYVETLFGRRRYLPEIHSSMPQLIAQAERMAINMPIQGTQADILKLAMIKIADWLTKTKLDAKMLLQVHDELVFEVARDDVKSLEKQVKEIMSSVIALDVPLVVDVGTGKSWCEIDK